jgi:uncharacterized protein (DUF952 family)
MIVHFARKQEWLDAQEGGEYVPADFEADGFIHCAAPSQAAGIANELFTGQDDLVLLWITPPKVGAGVVYERAHGAEVGDLFPHIHGPLNVDAVLRADELASWGPGGFVLPKEPTA